MQTKKGRAKQEGNALPQLVFRYLPYWPLFVVLVIVCCIGAWKFFPFNKPMYEASVSIMIKDEKQNQDPSRVIESFTAAPANISVENEIEVLQSRSLMKQVVERLHLYAPVFEEDGEKALPAYTSSPVIVKAKNPGQFKEHIKIPIAYNKESGTVTVFGKQWPLDVWSETPQGILMFSVNERQRSDPSHPLFFQLVHPRSIAGILRSYLTIVPINKNSSVVLLKLRNEIAERGEDILNELAAAYSLASMNDKNAMAANTLSFVEERIRYVEAELDSLETKIQLYKSRKGIVDLSEQGKLFLQNLGSNDQRSADIGLQLAVLGEVEKYVVSKENKASIVPSTLGVTDPMLNDLLQKLYEAEIQYDKLKRTTAENNPILLSLKGEIDKIRPSILENITNQRQSIRASKVKVDQTSNSYSSVLRTIPKEEKDLLDFSRQQAIKSSVYTYLLQKREEAALSQSVTVADNRIIDPAEAFMIPNGSRRSTIYMMAVLLGIGLGLVYVYIKEKFSTRIMFRDEIEELSNIPVVAELPKIKSASPLVVQLPEHIAMAEQFRQLRASIGLYGRSTQRKKILVSSSISGEGKSFVSANLALSLASSGKRVVLLDLDLRNPKTSEIFNLTQEKGVVDFLTGECEWIEIVRNSAYDQLCLVPAGSIHGNPTELLLSERLGQLFSELSKNFDYIIMDTSPVDPVTDAYVLSEYCDITLFVIRHAYTPKTMVQLLDESSKVKVLKNMVVVFNAVKSRGFIQKKFGFGFGYGYDHVYNDRVYRRKVAVKQ